MVTLKNCPFCGGMAKAKYIAGRAAIGCTRCEAEVKMPIDVSVGEAIRVWNTRVGETEEERDHGA